MKLSVVEFAHQILDMQQTIQDQQVEIYRLRRYEEDYHALMNQTQAHNEKMMGNILQLVMTPGVVQACESNAYKLVSTVNHD